MDAPDTAFQGQDSTVTSRLYMALELGEKNWKLSLGSGAQVPSRCTVAAGDTGVVLIVIAKTRLRGSIRISMFKAG
ncbi:hypothetical protein VL15_14830 [Burkholderia cepacia]|uniref:Uncharacterized protein n=1 Tax=Burkholderia cepacia TaxID=292 RepID=A0A0J5WYT7_BURCE|nr:hypothetical protein [Burkholderia cepacia]KML57008.1 hypothetical protein VL15_14830 [Burkholderia cepacia]